MRFEFASAPEITRKLFAVQYRQALPARRAAADARRLARQATLIKSDKWSYKREWRILTEFNENLAAPPLLAYPPEALTAIMFGVRTPTLHKTLISKILRDRPDVKFYRAMRRPRQFLLNIQLESIE